MITIFDALREAGVSVPYESELSFQIRCPFHKGGQELGPSARVYPDTQSMYCFTEHKSWNPVAVLAAHYEISYAEALRRIGEKHGAFTSSGRVRPAQVIAECLLAIRTLPLKDRINALLEFDSILASAAKGDPDNTVSEGAYQWLMDKFGLKVLR